MAIIDDLNNLQTSIVTVKKVLADNINAKGVSVSENDTLTTLSNAVKDIPQEGGGGSITIPEGTKFGYSTFQTLPNEMVSYMNTIDDYQRLFYSCSSMTTADMSSLSNISNAKEMAYMFSDNGKLETVVFPEGLKPYRLMNTFDKNKSLTNINFEDLDLSECITLKNCFSSCSGLTTVTLPESFSNNLTNVQYLFDGCSGLTTVTLPTTFPSNHIDCEYMFRKCTNLTTINNFDKLKKVKKINYMFSECSSGLTEVVWNNIEYSGETIGRVFEKCNSLSSVTLNGGVYNVYYPFNADFYKNCFYNCSSLTTCSMTNIRVNLVESHNGYGVNMSNMFEGCSGLTEVNLSNWTIGGFSGTTTTNINDLQNMFKNCTALTTIDFSGWDFNQVKTNTNMFQGCNSLSTIIMNNCSDESIAKMQTIINNNGKQNQVTIITDDI